MIELPRSTYYYRPSTAEPGLSDERLVELIRQIQGELPGYGYRRVTHELRRRGHSVNHKRVARVMKADGLGVKPRRRVVRTTDSEHAQAMSPNLYRNVIPSTPDTVWVADITYIRIRHGFCYLAAILDACSRKVVGYALSRQIDTNLALAALTANQTLKTVIAEAEAAGDLKAALIDASPASSLKPDFVYFSPPGEYDRIVVVELKNPGQKHHLTYQNELQLITYMSYIKTRYPKADMRGYLIGNNNLNMTSQQKNIDVLDWSDVLKVSRKGHVELLASMLVGAHPDINDSRVAQVAEYGGKEALELLERLAVNDEDVRALMPGMQIKKS